MTDNPYPLGTLENYAYQRGYDHGLCWTTERETPLDGQWAGSPLTHEVIREAWQSVLGDTWDTYVDGDQDDRDGDDSILDAWEEGYRDSFVGRP